MDFKEIEAKWQKWWEEHPGLYEANSNNQNPNSKKKYILVEFPYPSGSGLHIGHAFTFTGGDVYARFKRMQGYNVMFPMGWDAFGLPTENYAIKVKRKPQEVTKENTEMFKSQMKRLAFSFDWAREVNTTDPNYYKWTQWIFIKLFEKGLAYKQEMPINWCPSCKIGLANEEVLQSRTGGGVCERCGAEVSRRNISQWVVKITDYAERLISGLEKTDFIEKVKRAQINWIGKSEGARVKFQISNDECQMKELEVFTTRADTLYGVTFMVISPEHPFVDEIVNEDIKNYKISIRSKSDMERTELNKEKMGVFSGVYVVNPVNGKKIPLWVADYVLMSYGTGVVMGVPGHDERDNEFAKKYKLPIVKVIDEGEKMINSEMLNGMPINEAIVKMNTWVEEKGIGKKTAMYHLRDWIFSRQHYWGEPIPMVTCPVCGWVAEKAENLPIKLPEVEAYEPTDDGKSPLSKVSDWVKTVCPKCGGEAKRETDTMPNWAGSDWYYLRYIDAHNENKLADFDLLRKWLPVDVYVGGDEHNTLHLLYSRFIHQFLYDQGVVPTPEPYFKRMSHGVILGADNQRMSKSRGNVIVPETVADKYGVDVARLYLMFMGPFTGTMAWNEKTLMGVKRFLERFEGTVSKQILNIDDSNNGAEVIMNKAVKGISEDLEDFGYNTAIAKLMKLINEINRKGLKLSEEQIKNVIRLIAPLAPYIAEELYSRLGGGSVHGTNWPVVDEGLLVAATAVIPVAVNGKVRDQIEVRVGESKEKVLELVKKLEKIKKWIEGKKVVKEIYVPGKMISMVVE